MKLRNNYTGQKIGCHAVLGFAGWTDHAQWPHAQWRVRCDCGNEFICLTQALKQSRCKKCNNRGPRPWSRKRPYEWRYNASKNRARHPMLLTYEEFFNLTQIRECHYCGDVIHWGEPFGQKRLSGLNLDRKNNDLPYAKGNVVVSCKRCNYGKNKFFTYEEWKQLGNVIRSWTL